MNEKGARYPFLPVGVLTDACHKSKRSIFERYYVNCYTERREAMGAPHAAFVGSFVVACFGLAIQKMRDDFPPNELAHYMILRRGMCTVRYSIFND